MAEDLDESVDFTPLTDFYSEANQTHYIAGLGYTATTYRLKQLVQQWIEQGLVVRGRRAASVGGHGTVT